MKLVACPKCHAQFDVADCPADSIACPCGTAISTATPVARDLAVTRCAACGALVGGEESSCSYCRAAVTRKPERAGPVCPECLARNPVGARHCTSCGIAFLPQPARTRIGTWGCPACKGVRLVARNLGGLWVEECPTCLGLWASGDVMDRLVDRIRDQRRKNGAEPASRPHAERRAAWQAEVSYRHCPECQGAMQRKNFGRRSGVVVDWCGSHGTWLDAHEMGDIAAFVLEGGLEQEPAQAPAVAWSLPALAGERNETLGSERLLRGIGDFLAQLLK